MDATTARTAARTSSSGSAQAADLGQLPLVGPGLRPTRTVPVRATHDVEDLSLRRSHGAGLEQQHRAEAPEHAPAPVGPGGGGRGRLGGLGQIDGVGESPFVQMGAHVRHERAELPGAAPASGQCLEHRAGAPPQLGDTVAQGDQPARDASTRSANQPRVASALVRMASRSTGAGTRRCPRAASAGHAELADQLVHGGAADVDDPSASRRARPRTPRARRANSAE